MEYKINYSNWDEENFVRLFSMLQKQPDVNLVLYLEKQEKTGKETLGNTIGSFLNRLGFSPHLKGYGYIKYGVLRCIEHPEDMESVTKVLYPKIAQKYATTPGKVEHGVRHAIKKAWETEKNELWEKVFGKKIAEAKSNPTNAQFIATLSDYITINNYML